MSAHHPVELPATATQILLIDSAIDEADRAVWTPFGDIESHASKAAAAFGDFPDLKLELCEATVAFSTDAAVAELNGTYRGKPKPTNVLSFPAPRMPTPRGAPRFLGDVILAAETILREAEELRVTPVHHLQHLVVHGLLHLLGFDHETDAEAAIMESLETRILATLGIADPYAE